MTDCRILVLGGSSGIGLAIAERLAAEPAVALSVTVPSADAVTDVEQLLGRCPEVHVVDLLDVATSTIDTLTSAPDVLILCAGIEYVGPVEHEPPGTWDRTLAINTTGPLRFARSAIPGMIERGRGFVVALGSVVSADPRPFLAAYSASKVALESYLISLSGELNATGVDVRVLRLGPVATELGSHGPPNWMPETTSPYRDAYLTARAAAERERSAEERQPEDVAGEVVEMVRSFLREGS